MARKTKGGYTQPFTDPYEARIDPLLPVEQRIRRFLQQGGDPYAFRVGETGVRVEFTDGAPSLQVCMEDLCGKPQ